MSRDDAYGFMDRLPGSEFMTDAEKEEAAELLQPSLESIHTGMGKDWAEHDSDIQEFFDYMGLSDDSPLFWEAFREWYE